LDASKCSKKTHHCQKKTQKIKLKILIFLWIEWFVFFEMGKHFTKVENHYFQFFIKWKVFSTFSCSLRWRFWGWGFGVGLRNLIKFFKAF
jgi:hypothetical protein